MTRINDQPSAPAVAGLAACPRCDAPLTAAATGDALALSCARCGYGARVTHRVRARRRLRWPNALSGRAARRTGVSLALVGVAVGVYLLFIGLPGLVTEWLVEAYLGVICIYGVIRPAYGHMLRATTEARAWGHRAAMLGLAVGLLLARHAPTPFGKNVCSAFSFGGAIRSLRPVYIPVVDAYRCSSLVWFLAGFSLGWLGIAAYVGRRTR